MIRILIVDDERLARAELRHLLTELSPLMEYEVIAEVANANEAEQLLNSHQVDLMFLDVEMPGRNGFELLEDLGTCPPVIFTTAYDQYALEAFNQNALDYLQKPIELNRLTQAVKKFQENIKSSAKSISPLINLNEQTKVFLKDGEKCWFVNLDEIYSFLSIGNYCRVFVDDAQPLIRKSLQQLEQRLPSALFFRVNRQQIVNLQKIDKVDILLSEKLAITLTNGQTCELSRRQSQLFKQQTSL